MLALVRTLIVALGSLAVRTADRAMPELAKSGEAVEASERSRLPDAVLPDAVLPDVVLPDVVLLDAVLPDTVLPDAVIPDLEPKVVES